MLPVCELRRCRKCVLVLPLSCQHEANSSPVSRSSCCRGTVQDPNSQRGQTDSFTAGMNPSFWSRTQAAKLDPHRPRGFSGSVLGDQVDNQNRQWT